MTAPQTNSDRAAAQPAADAAAASLQGPGRMIRLAREHAGHSPDELARLTRLSRATLEALERDDFAALTEPVYVRGYYRKCAKALNLGEGELIAAYERLAAPKAPPAPTKLVISAGERGFRRGRRGTPRWLLWPLLLGVLVGAGVWLLRKLPEYSSSTHALFTTTTTTVTPPAASSVPAPAGSAVPAAPPPPAGAPPPAPTAAPPPAPAPAEAPGPAAPNAAVPAPASAPPAAATPAPGAAPAAPVNPAEALVLHFNAASWVRIEDSTGAVLLSGTIPAGQQQSLSGKPPYSVFLGNAPGVSLSYGGQAVDLQAYIRDNATARLTVPAAAKDGG